MARQSLLSVLLDLNADGFEKGLQKAQRSMRGTSRKLKRSGANLTRNVTAPLTLIGATSFKVAADFEQGMAKVKAVSGATAGEFKNLRDNAMELGRSTRFSASEVSALQLEFSKLGFTADEITQVTGATLNLAQATGSDLAQSAEVAGATLRAFGLDASETQRVTDVMAASFSASALDMGSFQDSMKFVAPVAAKAGLSIEETTAMLAQLANNGIKGSAAGTALRRILSTVGATGGDVKTALADLSKEVVTLGDAKDEVGRTAQSAFLVLKDGLGDVDSLTESFNNSQGAAKGMADIMDDTAEGAMKRMQSAVEGAQIAIGTALAPVVVDVAKAIGSMAQSFSELSPAVQKSIVGFGAFTAAIGPAKMVTGNLGLAMSKSKTAVKGLSKAMKFLAANPTMAIVTALGLIVTAAIAFNASTDGMTEKQREQLKVTRQQNIELAKQAGLLKKATNMDAATASIADLRAGIAQLTKDIEKINVKALQDAVTVDLTAQPGKKIQLGDAFDEINPESKKQVEKSLREQLNILTGQAASQGLFGDEAMAFIKRGLDKKLNSVVALYRKGLLDKKGELAAALEEATSADQGGDSGGGSETTVAIKVAPTFEATGDGVSKLMDQLSVDINAAFSALSLTGDDQAHADALAQAYGRAAQAAAEIGNMGLAEELQAQANAAGEVDKVAQIMQNLQQEMGLAKLQSDAFGESFDFVGAQSAALQQAINDMLELGLKPTSEEVAKLIEQMQNLGSGTEEMNAGMVAVAENLGNVFSTMFNDMATAQEDLAQAVADGEMTMAEASEEGQKRRVKAARNAALNIARIFLAEAMAGVIKESFSKAPPPIAAGIAAAGVAGVNALFNNLVKLKEGGMTMGPQLALIGDNPSGKEAVIPFEKMGRFLDMAGVNSAPQHVVVTGRISGRDILLSNERNSIQKTRQRGF